MTKIEGLTLDEIGSICSKITHAVEDIREHEGIIKNMIHSNDNVNCISKWSEEDFAKEFEKVNQLKRKINHELSKLKV